MGHSYCSCTTGFSWWHSRSDIGTLHVLGLETPPSHATALIPTGGILVFITTIWFLDKIGEGYLSGYDAGYGLYLCLIGGILAIINAVGLKEV